MRRAPGRMTRVEKPCCCGVRGILSISQLLGLALALLGWGDPVHGQGSLLLMGGGDDRRTWADPVFRWFVQQADSGKIINIDVDETAASYASTFKAWGAAASSHPLQIATRASANDSATYRELVSASGIFIEGGDQWDYVSTWKGTLVEKAIEEVFARGGAIGGTSAGLAVLGEVVFDAAYGTAYPEYAAYNPYYARIHFTDDFLDILSGVLTDSHFQTRARLGRLVPMLARRIQDYAQPDLMGIGVDESTALCVNPDLTAVAYGVGSVTILYRSENSRIVCEPNRPVTFTDICFDQLVWGAVYDLRTRTLIDPGPYLQPLAGPAQPSAFTPLLLYGGADSTAEMGEVVITNLTSGEDNAFYGRLGQRPGRGLVPQAVIIPKVWNNRTFAPNRIVGGQWGAATHPGYTALFLGDNSTCAIDASGTMTVEVLAYVLDTSTATHAGVPRGTNVPGIVGARLHFLASGDRYDLARHEAVTAVRAKLPPFPQTHLLVYNFPNPFSRQTCFSYWLPAPGEVTLEMFNVRGQQVGRMHDQWQEPGWHTMEWEASLPRGVYLYRLVTSAGCASGRCVVK
ncbi:MAG: cyanophycinase [Calditrichaeota bacterium]|nr:cyanophycinase [Calditrichota bacterium]